MRWVQRFFGQIFYLLFLVGLLLTAFTFSVYQSFSQPANLQKWLSQSRLYDHFTDGIAEQSFNTISGQGSSAGNSAAFQEAAKLAFTPELIEQSVNAFINSNYDWLQGTTPAPNFSIDLTAAKATFARQVALSTQQRLFSLPACTAQQAAQYTPGTDPLSLTCLPPGVNPAQLGQEIQQKLLNSQEFLSDPVITADNLNPKGGEPYYRLASDAPRYYQFSQYASPALAGLTVLFGTIAYYLSPTRRTGARRVGLLLGMAGVILVAGKFATTFVLEKIRTSAFNNTNVGELQSSLTDFMGLVESAILGMTLWFGVAYIAAGAILLIGLFLRRKRTPHHHKAILDDEPSNDEPAKEDSEAKQATPKPPIMTDVAPPPKVQPTGPPPLKPDVQPRKKPRLIQL